MHVVSINLAEIETFGCVQILLELLFFLKYLSFLSFNIDLSNIDTTSHLWKSSSLFRNWGSDRILISRCLSELFTILESPHDLAISSSEFGWLSCTNA